MIKGLHVTMQPFAEHLLTPTLKVKRYVVVVCILDETDSFRQVAAKHFRKEIDRAYEESEDPSFSASFKSERKAKL
jgi:hypothetical protein